MIQADPSECFFQECMIIDLSFFVLGVLEADLPMRGKLFVAQHGQLYCSPVQATNSVAIFVFIVRIDRLYQKF